MLSRLAWRLAGRLALSSVAACKKNWEIATTAHYVVLAICCPLPHGANLAMLNTVLCLRGFDKSEEADDDEI